MLSMSGQVIFVLRLKGVSHSLPFFDENSIQSRLGVQIFNFTCPEKVKPLMIWLHILSFIEKAILWNPF